MTPTTQKLAEKEYPTSDKNDLNEWFKNQLQECRKAAFIKGYEANQSKWISVEDALPEQFDKIMFYRKDLSEQVYQGSFKYGEFFEGHIYYTGVTHWQPLPPKP